MRNLTMRSMRVEPDSDSHWHDEDYEAGRFARLDPHPHPRRLRVQEAVSLLIVGGGAWLLLLFVFWLAAHLTASSNPVEIGWLIFWRMLLALTAAFPLIGLAIWSWITIREKLVYIERVGLVRDRMMNPTPARLLSQLTLADYAYFYERAMEQEEATAPYRIYRGVEAVHVNTVRGASTQNLMDTLPTSSVPADPVEVWIDDVARREAHILLAGKTASGKTTTGAALLARRIDAGDHILVIDPHATPGKWWGIDTVVGAGRDYEAISLALTALEREMDRRYRRLSEGQPAGGRLTVLIDEAPAISDALDKRWKSLTTRLGSEARKVGIAMIILSQSPLVEDLQLNSIMRRNYSVIGLDMASIRQMMREARVPDRDALLEALEGQPYPALREIDGTFRICDRSGIDRIRPSRPPAVWSVPQLPSPPEKARFADTDSEQAQLELLCKLRRAGVTREQAREAGFQFDNSLWARAGEVIANEPTGQEQQRTPHDLATIKLSDTPSARDEHQTSNALSEDRTTEAPARTTECRLCGSPVEITDGRTEVNVWETTALYGCEQCKAGRTDRPERKGKRGKR